MQDSGFTGGVGIRAYFAEGADADACDAAGYDDARGVCDG